MQFSEFVWTPHVAFNNFLLIDATDRSKISNDQKRLFFAVSLYPLSFFANTPFKPDAKLFRLPRRVLSITFQRNDSHEIFTRFEIKVFTLV